MDIGFLIRQARLEKGYTQEELAEMVGVKKSAVAKWENGRVSEIKRSNLKMLAESLGLKPSDLFGWSEEIKEDPKKAAEKAADILLDPDLSKIMEMYVKMDTEQRKHVLDYMTFLSER